MRTECSSGQLEFQGLGSRQVVAAFNAGRLTQDGGLLLLREVAERSGLIRRFAACFRDQRRPERIEHRVEELLAQRVLAQAQGYEDLNDHDTLRDDPLLAVAAARNRDWSLNIFVSYWFHPPRRWKALQFDEKVNLEIMRRFADEGIKLALPATRTYLSQEEGQAFKGLETG